MKDTMLHKIDETCGSHVETEGCAPNNLFRRHFESESERLVQHHAASTLNLLESLGLVINYTKSQLVPSQQI